MDFISFQTFDFVPDTFMSSSFFFSLNFTLFFSVFTTEHSLGLEHIEWVFGVFPSWFPLSFRSCLCLLLVTPWPQMQVWILLGTLFMSTRSSFYRDWIWEKTVWFLIGQLTSVLLTTSVPGPLLFILYASVSSEESLRVTFDFISYCLFYVLMLLLRMLRLEK